MESNWPEILTVLQTRMSRSTYDHLLAATVATRKNGTLTILTPRPLTIEWLDHRLRPLIESAVTVAAGKRLKIKFAPLKEASCEPRPPA